TRHSLSAQDAVEWRRGWSGQGSIRYFSWTTAKWLANRYGSTGPAGTCAKWTFEISTLSKRACQTSTLWRRDCPDCEELQRPLGSPNSRMSSSWSRLRYGLLTPYVLVRYCSIMCRT